MTGEREAWFQLALRLHQPVQRVMAETTSREFVDWQWYFKQELNKPTREEIYLAQVAREVRRTVVKNPSTVALEHMVLKFGEEATKPKSREAYLANSKAAWGGLVKQPARQPPQRPKE